MPAAVPTSLPEPSIVGSPHGVVPVHHTHAPTRHAATGINNTNGTLAANNVEQ